MGVISHADISELYRDDWKDVSNHLIGGQPDIEIVRTAAKVVAASDADATCKLEADYVCSGTNDEVTINAAITALGTNGGQVVLLPGTYNTVATITYSPQSIGKFLLTGYGAIIDHNASASDWCITLNSNLKPTSYMDAMTNGQRWVTIEGLTIVGDANGGGGILAVDHTHGKLRDLIIAGYTAGDGIRLSITDQASVSSEHWTIADSHIAKCQNAIKFTAAGANPRDSFNGLTCTNLLMASDDTTNNSVGMYFHGQFQGAVLTNCSYSPISLSKNQTAFYFDADCSSFSGMVFISPMCDEGGYHSSGTVYGFDFEVAQQSITIINPTFAGAGITANYYNPLGQHLVIFDASGNIELLNSGSGAHIGSANIVSGITYLGAYDTDTSVFTPFIRLTSAATPTCIIEGNIDVNSKTLSGIGGAYIASGGFIAGSGTGANGVLLKNMRNAAASALSGTQKDIEIDIGGVPYYFTVYPTKA